MTDYNLFSADPNASITDLAHGWVEYLLGDQSAHVSIYSNLNMIALNDGGFCARVTRLHDRASVLVCAAGDIDDDERRVPDWATVMRDDEDAESQARRLLGPSSATGRRDSDDGQDPRLLTEGFHPAVGEWLRAWAAA